MANDARTLLVFSLVIPIALTACHHATRQPAPPPVRSDVSYQPVPDKSTGHYQLTSNQGTTGADLVPGNPVPVYPSSMIRPDREDVEIAALLIVGRDGHVHEVRIAASEANGEKAPFALAVAAATLKWRFTPLKITTWQDTPDGGSRRIAAKPEPFSQRYRFHFAIVDGKPDVTSGPSDNTP